MRCIVLIVVFLVCHIIGLAQAEEIRLEICADMVISKKNRFEIFSAVIDGDTIELIQSKNNSYLLPFAYTYEYRINYALQDHHHNYSDRVDTNFINNNKDSVSLIWETKKYTCVVPIAKWELLCGGLSLCIKRIRNDKGLFTYNVGNCSVIGYTGIGKVIKK